MKFIRNNENWEFLKNKIIFLCCMTDRLTYKISWILVAFWDKSSSKIAVEKIKIKEYKNPLDRRKNNIDSISHKNFKSRKTMDVIYSNMLHNKRKVVKKIGDLSLVAAEKITFSTLRVLRVDICKIEQLCY